MAVELVWCPHYQSGAVVKYGTTANGKERFRCQNAANCGRTFICTYAYQGRLPQVKRQIVEMTLNGSGVRDIARVLQISPTTVIEELKKRPRPCSTSTKSSLRGISSGQHRPPCSYCSRTPQRTTHTSKSAAVRARLNHPVIDSDGHTVEFEPAFLDYLQRLGGSFLVERYRARGADGEIGLTRSFRSWYQLSPAERRDQRLTRLPWWGLPTKNALDRATATLPKLLYERLDDIGLDFTVLYPTLGLLFPHKEDEELRRAGCRAMNTYHADIFREYADRMAPAALIPMHTPQEAIDELEYVVQTLGLKAVVMAGHVLRPIPAVTHTAPEAAPYAFWLDHLCLDSAYDYDPVWARCVELGVAPTFHSGGMGWGSRTSISNYMYNHIGHFASAGEALCKALFMSGVTRRFPALKFAFLECGVGWACSLYADMIGHWEKRNGRAMENYNPANLNRELLLDIYRRYGGRLVAQEAYESVEKGKLTEEDFRDFVFVHPAKLWTDMNPNFFKGTRVEQDVAKLLNS